MNDEKNVEITTRRDVTIVSFNEVPMGGIHGIEAVSREIAGLIQNEKPTKMVVDFERVRFLSSQTLGLLLDIRQKLQAYDADVVISGIDPQLHRVFRITNLDKIFDFYPNSDSAVIGINKAGNVNDD